MPRDLVEYAIDESKTLTVKTVSYLSIERNYIDQVLKKYLMKIEKPFLMNQVAYCLHELAANANRANLKRVYFKEKGLDIRKASDYEKGLKSFKKDVFERIPEYHEKQKSAGLYIKIDFQLISHKRLRIRVRNNTPMTNEEKDRISRKFLRLNENSSLPEVYHILEDYSEGAGFGLYMILNLLQRMGLGSNALQFKSNDEETMVSLLLNAEEGMNPEDS